MKKHIFGIALFCSIVASFALIYAFIYAPVIPQIAPVKQFETKYEKPYSCKMKRQNVSFEVISSEYFYDENKIVTEVKLKSLNNSIAPENVYLNVTYSQQGATSGFSSSENKTIENPFSESNEKIVKIATTPTEKISRDENLYVLVNATDYDGSTQYKRSDDLTKAKAVLFVHGKSSIIKK